LEFALGDGKRGRKEVGVESGGMRRREEGEGRRL
jgi:hypothetical protein